MAVAVVLLGSGFYWLYRVLMEQIRKIAGNFDLYYSGFCGVIEECCEMAGRSFGVPSEDLEELIYAESITLHHRSGSIWYQGWSIIRFAI